MLQKLYFTWIMGRERRFPHCAPLRGLRRWAAFLKSAELLEAAFARTASPLLSHFIDRGPTNRPPCAFSALYISQRCSTEFRHLVWANKTHFLQLLRGSHKPDVSTSLTQRQPCKTVPLRSEHIWQMPILWCSFITVNEKRYFVYFRYLCRLHTIRRLFYSQHQAERTRMGEDGGAFTTVGT